MMLEKELGVQLFFRNNKGISLTEAGRSLERNAKRIMSLIEFARRDLNEAAQGEHGILSIGYVGFAMDGVLPAIIDRFRK
jgi:DNA-binding transcriptional LysR family regulator